MKEKEIYDVKIYSYAINLFFIFIFLVMVYLIVVSPYINVWQERMAGQAELARAESNRQIATLEALAKKESSKALAEAEVIRAEGVAKANKIIGDSLKNNDGYLHYLWIQGLQTNQMQVVYVPTESNLPILESQRLKK
jgi:regulator of protease activity HflC (stomatin/prohibitin superfamily)